MLCSLQIIFCHGLNFVSFVGIVQNHTHKILMFVVSGGLGAGIPRSHYFIHYDSTRALFAIESQDDWLIIISKAVLWQDCWAHAVFLATYTPRVWSDYYDPSARADINNSQMIIHFHIRSNWTWCAHAHSLLPHFLSKTSFLMARRFYNNRWRAPKLVNWLEYYSVIIVQQKWFGTWLHLPFP